MIERPRWAPAKRRHNSQTVSAVIYVKCSTEKRSGLMAFKAVRTVNRGRPDGAVINLR